METPAPCFGFSFSTATRWSAEARQDTRCGDRHEGEGPHARLLQPPAAPLARHLMVVGMASSSLVSSLVTTFSPSSKRMGEIPEITSHESSGIEG